MTTDVLKGIKVKFKLNKYIVVALILLFWLCFLDNRSIIDLIKTKQEIEQLESEKKIYLKKISEDKQKIKELKTSKENLEKFAREQYLMKKRNEDIYIITNKTK